ncbi:hypothetical protein SLINC_1590 [Streptomyces lincolnensis]|uniref:Uncharacterized protein n=1 Tax=Streptomyces lincolnensis TaxID=1915 RepID=A0A1B1M5Q5_STRLN|nr:hypothetical protein [Streptomyces lincolnensis]ANS63814.1 hypothetical protein SLINC_1590 [Streptomyces lincolnensis]
MGTAERREALSDDETTHLRVRQAPEPPGLDRAPREHPAGRREAPEDGTAAREGSRRPAGPREAHEGREAHEEPYNRPLWVEEPAQQRRLPDPVRTSAVRAVLIIAVTLVQAMVAFLCTMAGSWLAFPMVLSSVASTVVATWGALDVWVTRQVWNQRNGVVSVPSSTARALRRERRRARRQARTAERAQARIRRREGRGQVAHP